MSNLVPFPPPNADEHARAETGASKAHSLGRIASSKN